MRGQSGEAGRDGGKYGDVAESMVLLQAGEALEIYPVGLILEPVEHFVEETGVEAGERGGREQEGFGVEEEIAGSRAEVPGDAKGPLAPKQIEGGGAGLGLKVGRRCWQSGRAAGYGEPRPPRAG